MKKIFLNIVKLITDYTSGIPFVIWSIGGIAVGIFLYIFRDYEFIQFDKIIYIMIFSAVWFIGSDITKKKKILSRRIHFILDSLFYLSIFGSMLYFSGGFKSNLFFVFFLAAISAPLFATVLETFIFLFLIGALNYLIYYYTSEGIINVYDIGIVTLWIIFYFLIAGMVKFFQKKYLGEIEKVKKSQIESLTAHERLISLMESIKLGVIMIDLNFNIILANPAAKTILGKSLSEPITFKDLEEELKGANLSQSLSSYIKDGKPLNIQEIMIRNRYFRVFMSPALDITKKIFIGAVVIIRDIAEHKLLDRTRTEIISITSHQLRTPLSVIKGNLEMVLEGDVGKITKEQKEILEEAFWGNERMIKLINDLMDVSKITEGKLELKLKPTKLENLVVENIKELLPVAQKKRVSLSYKPSSIPLPKVNIDSQKIKQVLQNLIDNAIKYSRIDSKGKVIVKIQKTDNFLKTIIKDNGAGIPKEEQDQIFKRFFRASNISKLDPGGGAGLGLYISKGIIEQSKGKIWFESEENKGTTFYFTLPYQ